MTSPTQLDNDVRAGLAASDDVRAWCPHTDASRLLVVVTAATTSERYLPVTLPLVLRQARAAGLAVDVVLGLNNGYRCDAVVADVAARTGVPVAEVVPSVRGADGRPGLVPDPAATMGPAPSDTHRIVVVAQPAGPFSRAKTRLLHDILGGLLLPAVRAGWVPPRWTLLMDAESMLADRRADPTAAAEIAEARSLLAEGRTVPEAVRMLEAGGATPGLGLDPRTPALARLLDRANADGLDLVGAVTRFTAFRSVPPLGQLPVWLPAPAEPVAGPYDVYSLGCGLLPGCHCLSGAATLGRTGVILALMSTILDRHADVYGEDALLTVLAGATGLRARLDPSVQVTNRCPGWSEVDAEGRPAWLAQVRLWYAGFAAVAERYGSAAADVVGPSADDARAAGVVLAARTAAAHGPAAGQEYLARMARSAALMSEIPDVTALAGAR